MFCDMTEFEMMLDGGMITMAVGNPAKVIKNLKI